MTTCYMCGRNMCKDGICQDESCGYVASWRRREDEAKEDRAKRQPQIRTNARGDWL